MVYLFLTCPLGKIDCLNLKVLPLMLTVQFVDTSEVAHRRLHSKQKCSWNQFAWNQK